MTTISRKELRIIKDAARRLNRRRGLRQKFVLRNTVRVISNAQSSGKST